MQENVSFRLMRLDDIEQIVYIEKNCFTLPWSREAFYNELTTNQYAKYIVMELNGSIIGYCGLWVILDEAHITNIAVLPQYRGKKLGDALLQQVLEFSRALGALTVSLEVRVSNKIAQSLYRKYGFKDGGIRKNYYVDNQEDALVMWVNFNE